MYQHFFLSVKRRVVPNSTMTTSVDSPFRNYKRVRVASFDPGVLNLGYCVVDFFFQSHKQEGEDEEGEKEEKDDKKGGGNMDYHPSSPSWWFEIKKLTNVSIGKSRDPIHTLTKNLIKLLMEDDACKEANVVYIERQLSRSPKNTVMCYTIANFFECMSFASPLAISLVPAKRKFEAIKFVYGDTVLTSVDFSCSGPALKKLSVEIANIIFRFYKLEKFEELFRTHKKRSDYADSFIQCFVLFLMDGTLGALVS